MVLKVNPNVNFPPAGPTPTHPYSMNDIKAESGIYEPNNSPGVRIIVIKGTGEISLLYFNQSIGPHSLQQLHTPQWANYFFRKVPDPLWIHVGPINPFAPEFGGPT